VAALAHPALAAFVHPAQHDFRFSSFFNYLHNLKMAVRPYTAPHAAEKLCFSAACWILQTPAPIAPREAEQLFFIRKIAPHGNHFK